VKIAATILTAPRPTPTLTRTVESLVDAGFSGEHQPRVYIDSQGIGSFHAHLAAFRDALTREPEADAHFVVQDDVIFCRGLFDYLQATLWPGPVDDLALCSPYCPEAYRHDVNGWNHLQSDRGLYLSGGQAWVFPAAVVRRLVVDFDVEPSRVVPGLIDARRRRAAGETVPRAALSPPDGELRHEWHHYDYHVGRWAKRHKLKVWHHAPSLAQHIGIRNSSLGDNSDCSLRHAADFIGEEADAMQFTRKATP